MIEGSFFDGIPAGADAYIFRHIIHDWNDDQCGHYFPLSSSCSIVAVLPAMVSVPLRSLPSFLATLIVTVPFPTPLAPDVTVSHDALLAAVHAHVLPVVTATEAVPPAGATF